MESGANVIYLLEGRNMEAMQSTAERIVQEGRRLIMTRGYNGFSYADIATRIGIRKASIHHHFAGKSELAKAVVDQSRALIHAQVEQLSQVEPEARVQLQAYARYWERCIADDTAPFCVAAMLAAELPSLPDDVAASVRAHFIALRNAMCGLRWVATEWISRLGDPTRPR